MGFLVLQFWLFFRMGFRFQCQKTPVFLVLVFIVLCTGFCFFFKLAFGFWALVKTIMDFQILYSMWFSVFPIFQSSSHESSICSTCHRQYRID